MNSLCGRTTSSDRTRRYRQARTIIARGADAATTAGRSSTYHARASHRAWLPLWRCGEIAVAIAARQVYRTGWLDRMQAQGDNLTAPGTPQPMYIRKSHWWRAGLGRPRKALLCGHREFGSQYAWLQIRNVHSTQGTDGICEGRRSNHCDRRSL